MASDDTARIFAVPTTQTPITAPLTHSYDDLRDSDTPLVIDNGSTTLRYGFATSSNPETGPNVISKYKDRRTNRPILLFGDAIEIESGAKAPAKYAWEGDVLLSFDAVVHIHYAS
jgi:actin-related protein 5